MSKFWLGFLKLVSFVLIGIAVVGGVGYATGGVTGAIIAGTVGALAVLYQSWKLVTEYRTLKEPDEPGA